MKSASGSFLVFRGVPQHPRPFASRPVIDLIWIGRAKNYCRERLGFSNRRIPSQVQGPISALDGLTLLCPRLDEPEDQCQIAVNSIPSAGGLEDVPFVLQSQQSRLQRFG